ncbi:mannitol/fructose-specific phosphotransferase system IIA component (Ntr-type) [Breznakia pachnodae]|uniref:Mannitol/fructose-specific phosphotransferase system IIA component (Ntr-type) n=2 Tax=Breznakia pachnodae TaxID=265178 RepID=A0ABU0E417_9FIRM|nr:mannitol/fructose-specific phosphotransferase system IIA component (Ntr-type) [Breznakia pachnodae]
MPAKESFTINLQYSIDRLTDDHTININDELTQFKNEKFFKDSLFIAGELSKMLEDEFDVIFPYEEIYLIALNITDKKFYEASTGNIVIDGEITRLVEDILLSIKNTYRLDFENDLDIFTMLVKHMIPLKIRVINGEELTNPLLEDIQNQYPFAMTIAKGINPIIEKYFLKRISVDELSYIAVAIQLAIEKGMKRDRRKKNVLIVCFSGNISSRLFEYRFQEMFKDSIGTSKICNYTDLINYDFTNIDYVFATVPIDIDLPIPVYQVTDQILSQQVSEEIQTMLDLSSSPLSNKFSPNLFFTHVRGKSKEELLKMMCDKSKLEKHVRDNFYELVLKRESMLQTTYGNLVALPHPYETASKETFVCVALLDEAILWGKEKVRAVFLVAISDNKNEEFEGFYDEFFGFVLDKDNITSLLDNQSFENLLRLIK